MSQRTTRSRTFTAAIAVVVLQSLAICGVTSAADQRGDPKRPDLQPLHAWWYKCIWPLPVELKTTLPEWVKDRPDDAEALFFLAMLRVRNVEGFADIEGSVAMDLLKRSAKAGYTPAVARLGLLTASGSGGIEADPVAGTRMIQQAVDANDPDGTLNLGLLSLDGYGGTPIDLERAEKLLATALDRGLIRAHSPLALLQIKKGSSAMAIRYLEAGAKLGDPNCMALLGDICRNGYLVPRSDELALRYMRQAAERGADDAQRSLAEMLRDGVGGPADPAESFFWANRAIKAGNMAAIQIVADAYLAGSGVQRDPPAALRTLMQAAQLGDTQSLIRLGRLHLEGILVERDVHRARQFFERAAKGASTEAKRYLEWIDRMQVN